LALTKPILNTVNAWDVSVGQTFTFNVVGGDQVVKNTLYILNNLTNAVVYTLTTTSYEYKAVVPANASGLVNGTYYSAYVVTYNSSNQTSTSSNTIQFYCYTTPSWAFNNISAGTVINNSSVIASISYSQIEGEALNDYTINLYDIGQNLLSSSGVKYTGSSASSQTVSYTFYGLEDNDIYYVRGFGHTVGGTNLDTGFINFSVSYTQPEAYSLLLLNNNCNDGYITYYSLAYAVEGSSYPSPPQYVLSQGEIGVNLVPNGYWVEYNQTNSNFIIPNNFTLKAWVVSPNFNSNLITLSNNDGHTIFINYEVYPFDSSKVMITVIVDNHYFIYSNLISIPSNSDVLCIQLRKINNIYEVLLGVMP
jgi:hypothetical protein